ncbi:ABC transporter B family member 26, chloroplastic-like isoform X1 [Salvia hispanica]|uniref:ABC transporter B family member 26, chloroplastic-like isoform X1 n=1 Tax=Salvia hispanica TaxID=49212 RepID=UPI002009DA63|nr:ABC transporter B family member 26, chloroplastic-like isoform X1 [Salvia hispanica]
MASLHPTAEALKLSYFDMAALRTAFHLPTYFNDRNTNSISISRTSLHCSNSSSAENLPPSSNLSYAIRRMCVSHAINNHRENCLEEVNENALRIIVKWFELIRDVFPGGRWWNLRDFEQNVDGSPIAAEPITVLQALREMWALLAEEKWILYTALGALAVAAVSEITMPGILAASVFSAQNGEMLVFYQNSWLLILLCITSGICSGLRSGCFAVANAILVKRLRKAVYRSLLLQDVSFFDTEAVGDLTSRVSTDCQRLSQTVGNDIHMILRNIFQGIGAFICLMTLSWPLALSSLVICCILSLIFLIYGQYQKKAALLAQNFVASSNEVAQETLSFIRTIRAYGTEKEELQRFTRWIERLASVGMRESVAYGLWTLSFSILYRSTQVLAVIFGGMSILSGHVSTEQLTKYILYCEWLIYAAWRLQDSMSSLLQSVGACAKVFQLMHLPPSSEFMSKGVKLQGLIGCVDFVNVSFHYSSRKMVPVLKNVNFSIKANEMVAIVGASGSGKSSLISLLLRLYEPTEGEILMNGVPLREMDMGWLRENIGYVDQEPHLFHMDIMSNLTYGCSRSIIGVEEIESATKNAHAHEFVSALPQGYHTVIDDNLLSGGQKQRIAIARALLRDPIILIFDEATSALDADSEGYIKEILQVLKKDADRRMTMIIVAQRLSTIKEADKIVVLEDGQVVETGTYTELHNKNGVFSRLFKLKTNATHFD